MTDLKVNVSDDTNLFFFQSDSHYPHPRNAFYGVEADSSRYSANLEVYQGIMAVQPVVDPVPMSVVEAFLSLANCNRGVLERRSEINPAAYDKIQRLYTNSVLLSRDESAARMLEIIGRRDKNVTFCSTDDEFTDLIPAALKALVAEGLAGLALVAYYQGNIHQVGLLYCFCFFAVDNCFGFSQ